MSIRAEHNPVRRWCRDLETRLRSGDAVRAEDYLGTMDGLDSEDALEVVYTEFVCREELGQRPDPDEYFTRFPQLRLQLEEQFLVHQALQDSHGPVLTGGQFIGPYELIREIGRGSRGAVFLAEDRRDKRKVALKLLLSGEYSTPAELILFRHEAEVLARLDHPNLVRIFDSGVHEDRPYLALEFAGCGTLSDHAAEFRQPADAAGLIETLARAVNHAHLQGVIHRDIKPSNILLAEPTSHSGSNSRGDAPGLRPMLTDFGLARVLDDRSGRTRTGDIIGTLAYMAPEQAAGTAHRAGPPADVYALGAILYDLLTGRPPFGTAPTAETLYRVLHEPPVNPRRLERTVPRALETITLKCLEKNPDRRYPTALALAEDLARFRRGERVAARSPGAAVELARWAKRRPSAAALAVVVFLTLFGLAAGTLYHNRQLQSALTDTAQANSDLRVSIARAEFFQNETSKANAGLTTALRTAETLRETTRSQNVELGKQLDRARRAMYALQLVQLPELWIKEPVRARRLLADPTACPLELRDFTWRYFHSACGLDERERVTHRGTVSAVAYLPDGSLASGGSDGRVRIWPAIGADGNQKMVEGRHASGVTGIGVGPGGEFLVTAGRDRVVKVWPRELQKSRQSASLGSAANGLAIASDGRTVAVPLDSGVTRLFRLPELKPVGELGGHTGRVLAVAFSPDGTILATSDGVGTIRVWRTADLSLARVWSAHPQPVRSVCFTPDGTGLVSGDDGGQVSIWDTATGSRLRVLSGHLFPVRAIAFGPGGTPLLTGGEDTYLKLWDPATGAELTNLMRRRVYSAAFSPDGEWVASGDHDGRVTYLRIPPFATVPKFTHTSNLATLIPRPDVDGIITGDAEGMIRVWEIVNPRPTTELSVSGQPVRALGVSSDGQILATAEGEQVVLVNVRNGRVVARLAQGHSDIVTAAAFHPEGRLLATGSADQTVCIWDIPTRELVVRLEGHTDAIQAVNFDPTGVRMVSAAEDSTARVWDTTDWRETHVLKGHTMWVLSAAFDPKGRWLATGSRDRTVRLWDLTGEIPPKVLDGYTNWVFGVAFSPDGRTLATASGHYSIDSPGEVKLLDPEAGFVRAILNDLRAPVAFAPTGDRLYSGVRGGVAELAATPSGP